MGERVAGTGEVLGTPLTNSVLSDHNVETSVPPLDTLETKVTLRNTKGTPLCASAVGENVGNSSEKGVKSSDLLGIP